MDPPESHPNQTTRSETEAEQQGSQFPPCTLNPFTNTTQYVGSVPLSMSSGPHGESTDGRYVAGHQVDASAPGWEVATLGQGMT